MCFIVRDANGHALAYVYFEEAGRQAAAKMLTRDEARRRLGQFRYHPPGGPWLHANHRSFLKTTQRTINLEMPLGGKFAAKSNARDENLVFLESDKLEVEIKGGRWVLAHQPAKPQPPKPVQHYFPDD